MSKADLYFKGARVWVPDREKVWVGGEVVSVVEGEGVEVQCEGEEGVRMMEVRSQDSLPLLRNPEILVGANDLTTLSYLHEPAVLHNLLVRFLHSRMIYTYCGIVLVALNPYQSLPIYGNETAAAYRGRDMGEMDPHVFAVAEEAYRRMTRDGSNQSLIISGESGAGKTVSAKFVMRYFATVNGASSETLIEKKVLASNSIMEAIGNAKTIRNDNSSRFGKYIEIRFDQKNMITGAHMRTYLLERSRVITHATDERSYHIFYQLCAVSDQPDMMQYQLGSAESFHYTSQGECVTVNDVNDQSEFNTTKEAMQLLGFHDDHLGGMFRVLSAILHLGNVEVGRCDKGGDVMSVIGEDDKHLVTATTLLGVDSAQLAHWLSHRKITTAREVYHKPLTHAQSTTARDSLAKHLYSTLFDWIVNIINTSLSPSSSSSAHSAFIGVLDIYGFEVFDENTFEQFCINYANEKLQQQFNMHVFQLEQAEYMREEIEWSFIDYYDNQPCIDLIENRLGVLDLLDETCKMPGGCDSLFTQKIYDNHNKPSSTHFTKPRMSQSAFQISHYAGPVQYQTWGFVEKNSEQVGEEYLQLLSGSSVPFMSTLFKPTPTTQTVSAKSKAGTNHRKKGVGLVSKATVGSQFRSSLHGLMTTLNSTTPHYIRCIKSNDRKLPFVFDPQRAVQQLRACGVLETVRLSAAGYPSRWSYNEFFHRYRLLLASGQVRREDVSQMCEYIVHRNIQDGSQYRFGKTKLFFRAGQVAYLERLRSRRQHEASVCVQRHMRGWVCRRWYGRLREATVTVQARARGLLARRLAVYLRRIRAAVCIQRQVRGRVARVRYQRLRCAALTTQAVFRGRHSRQVCLQLRYNQKAVVLQKYVRGWLARVWYVQQVSSIVLAQCCVRRWRAKRERRRLKMEARSVTHLHNLNKGLEKKIIELQMKLMEGERDRQTAQDDWNRQKYNYEEALTNAGSEIDRLKADLQLARVAANTATESQEAGPHSVPENESMELNPTLDSHAEPDIGCVESEPKLCSMESSQGSGMELDPVRSEMERLRGALRDSRSECGRLREELTALRREFDNEEPAPDQPQVDLSQPAIPPSQHSPSSEEDSFSLTPPSPVRPHPSALYRENFLPSKPGLIRPYSSTPDLQYGSTGISPTAFKERLCILGQPIPELGQGVEKLGQSAMKSGQGIDESGQSSRVMIELESDSSELKGMISESPNYESEWDSTADEIELLKELAEQLERERRNLLLGNREMYHELNKIDATKTATVSTLRKIAQENSFLRKELATFRNKEESVRLEVESSRGEVESLKSRVVVLKQALQQTSTAASLNVSLQQEVTRLTQENLSLLERVEDMRRTERTAYRTPMSPRRRTTPCGAESPRRRLSSTTRRQVTFSHNESSMQLSPWKPSDQSNLIRELILELKLEQVSEDVPCLPAHMIHLSLRYCRHVTGSCSQALAFMDGVTSAIQQVVQASSTQFNVLTFWLANITCLLGLLHNNQTSQTSFKAALKFGTTGFPSGIMNSDLSVRVDKLEFVGQAIYRDLFQLIHNRIQPLIVPGVLEYESIPNISSVRPIFGCHAGSHDPNITIATVTRELSAILNVLQKHSLAPEIIGGLMRQTFFMINAFLLNNLLLRRDMCHWSKGIQIRYNLSQLEDWVRGHRLTGSDVLSQLLPSVEAAKLLQMKKSTPKDADSICELCTNLNPLQVQKLLTMYSPANEFEERVPASIIRMVGQKNGADSSDPAHLMSSIDHIFPVTFPHSVGEMNYKTLSLPPALKHLNYLLTPTVY